METEPREINLAPAQTFTLVNERVIQFGPDGLPNLTVQPVLTRHHLQSLYFIIAAQLFQGPTDPLDPDYGKYDGMTIAEVMVRKQLNKAAVSGEIDQIEKAMDRLLGKPKNFGESVTVHASYEDFLKGVEAKEKAKAIPASFEENIFGDLGNGE